MRPQRVQLDLQIEKEDGSIERYVGKAIWRDNLREFDWASLTLTRQATEVTSVPARERNDT